MKLESIKDLEAIIKLCRKQGVQTISIDGVSLSLGDVPQKAKNGATDISEPKVEDQPSDEELLFWSAGN